MPAPWLLKRFVGVVRISAHDKGRWRHSDRICADVNGVHVSDTLRNACFDGDGLRALASRVRVIATDCSDPRASERLRVLAEELEKRALRSGTRSA